MSNLLVVIAAQPAPGGGGALYDSWAAWSVRIVVLLVVLAGVLAILARAWGIRSALPSPSTVFAAAWCLPLVLLLAWIGYKFTPHFRDNTVIRFKTGESQVAVNLPPPGTRPTDVEIDHAPKLAPLSSASAVTGVPPRAKEIVAKLNETDPIETDDAPDKSGEDVIDEADDSESELPEWIKTPRMVDGDTTLVVLSGKPDLSPQAAKQRVRKLAAAKLKEFFHLTYPNVGVEWSVPMNLVETAAIRQEFIEKRLHDLGPINGEMHRVHLQLELSPKVRSKLHTIWKESVDEFNVAQRETLVERRLWILGGLFGLVTLMLGTASAFLRLDASTDGAYRGRLKLAAVSLVAAGGVIVAMLA